MTGECGAPVPLTVPVWPKPVSIFGLLRITTFTERSHSLTIPSDPSPCPPDVGRPANSSRRWQRSCDRGYLVSRLSTARYLAAVLPRVLLMGQQAHAYLTDMERNDTNRFHVAPT